MSLSNNYPTIRPTLEFDFANVGALDPRITFARATTATFVNQLGVIQTAAAGVPRFDYDPSTLAARGLLVEEQRTNLLTYSEDFTTWNSGGLIAVANSTTAPDGTVSADLAYPSVSGDYKSLYKNVVGSGISVWSVFAKAAGKNWISIINFAGNSSIAWFNLQNGTVGTVAAGYTATIQSFGNGWYRCSVYYASGTFNYTQVNVVNGDNTSTVTANGTDGIYLWGAQGESGAFSTSYIPTVASTVTRNADVATVSTLTPWYNQSSGTLLAEIDTVSPTGANRYTAEIGDTTSNNRIILYIDSSALTRGFINNGGVTQANPGNAITIAANTAVKQALAYELNNIGLVTNGGTVDVDTSATIPTVTGLRIGANLTVGNEQLNGHVRRLSYYPARLTNAQLQALTS